MKLLELITTCDEGYRQDFSESSLLEFVHKKTGRPLERLPSPIGDTLALFIVRELAETFDPEATDQQQIVEAIRVIERAKSNLDSIVMALQARE